MLLVPVGAGGVNGNEPGFVILAKVTIRPVREKARRWWPPAVIVVVTAAEAACETFTPCTGGWGRAG
jgi:hypothetical protein